MKTLLALAFAACIAVSPGQAQLNTLTATTLSSAMASTDKTIYVTSATGINAPNLQNNTVGSQLFIVAPGQPRGLVALVTSVSSTAIGIRVSSAGGANGGYPSGSMVLIGQPNYFFDKDPDGGCVTASTFVTPYVNVQTGQQWLCSTITLSWVPGWQNMLVGAEAQVTALVASVAGATAINSPLQHINGTNAITSFTFPAGWNQGSFCIIPDAAFTTTATNNIGKASTAVAAKTLCYTYDATNSVYDPSY